MSLRLRLVSLWMPRYLMAREIERIRSSTDAALDALLAQYAPDALTEGREMTGGRLEDRRAAMAQSHERKVRALVEGVGRERAVRLGRESLFRTGLALGKEAKARLGVKDTRDDLLRAARVMYRVLGIDFVVVAGREGERMEVTRCSLSPYYTPETCEILSAIDEGTVSGLGQGASLRFQEHITDGSPRCVARLDFEESR
jgi:hypothetical protein